MYEVCKTLSMRSSASALNNNITACGDANTKDLIAIVHQSSVNIVPYTGQKDASEKVIMWKEFGGFIVRPRSLIKQAKFITFSTCTVFVITSDTGIQVFDYIGERLLFSYNLPETDSTHLKSHDCGIFAQGIAAVSKNLLCVGSYDGTILLFRVSPGGNNIVFIDRISAHDGTITDLCGKKTYLGSADIFGYICIWHEENDILKKQFNFLLTNSVCTTITIWNDVMIACYSSGLIKAFGLIYFEETFDVFGHSRAITSIDVAESSNLVGTVSEDGFVRIWGISHSKGAIVMDPLFYDFIGDVCLYGIVFLDVCGKTFCVSGYESKQILCYTMS